MNKIFEQEQQNFCHLPLCINTFDITFIKYFKKIRIVAILLYIKINNNKKFVTIIKNIFYILFLYTHTKKTKHKINVCVKII